LKPFVGLLFDFLEDGGMQGVVLFCHHFFVSPWLMLI
jgi:hypothetical protein